MQLISLKPAANIGFYLHSQNMSRYQGIEMTLASLITSPNVLLIEFLPLVPMTLGCVNVNVLERTASTSEHSHGSDKLDVLSPL